MRATEAPRARQRHYRMMLIGLNLVVGLVCLEVGLRLWEVNPRGEWPQSATRSTCFGPEGPAAPCPPGSDANGFRNARVPAQADIVALGDSQTRGVNALRDQAWPQQLARSSGLTVYNMSRGGFGVAHYATLLPDALALSPRVIIVGLYLGNDLYDTYRLVYTTTVCPDLRLADANDELTMDTVGGRATAKWDAEKTYHARWWPILFTNPGLWVRSHSAIGRRLDAALQLLGSPADAWHEIGAAWARENPELGTVFDDGRVQTILTPAYRSEALDLSEPRIAEGLRITGVLLPRMAEDAARRHTRLLVLLIPTKEAVFSQAMGSEGATLPGSLARLARHERACRAEILARCREAGIICVDLLPAFGEAVKGGVQVYSTTTESHPNRLGYALVARATLARLQELKWLFPADPPESRPVPDGAPQARHEVAPTS